MKKSSIILILLHLSQFVISKFYLVKVAHRKKPLEIAKRKSDLKDFISGGRNADIQEITLVTLSLLPTNSLDSGGFLGWSR